MDYNISGIPSRLLELEEKSKEIGFTMPSDRHIGSLLRTLVMSKPGGRFLELGTGIGLSLAWMVDGASKDANIISVDNDPELIAIAENYFSDVSNLKLICEDGSSWIKNYNAPTFDLIFADAWPGKHSDLDEVLELLNPGGFYVIDDMNAQANWPSDHEENVDQLVKILEDRKDLVITKFDWSTGVILGIKK